MTLAGRYRVNVVFDEPQRAITPGQAAVFYRDDLVLFEQYLFNNTFYR